MTRLYGLDWLRWSMCHWIIPRVWLPQRLRVAAADYQLTVGLRLLEKVSKL